MKTFCDRWTDKQDNGCEVMACFELPDATDYGIKYVGTIRTSDGRLKIQHWSSGGRGGYQSGNLIAIPPAPVVRPWANRAEMFAVCGTMPWFKRKDWISEASPQSFRLCNIGLWIDGTSWTWKELASLWRWYPHYGSDDGKPCVIEVPQTERTER